MDVKEVVLKLSYPLPEGWMEDVEQRAEIKRLWPTVADHNEKIIAAAMHPVASALSRCLRAAHAGHLPGNTQEGDAAFNEGLAALRTIGLVPFEIPLPALPPDAPPDAGVTAPPGPASAEDALNKE